MNFVRSSYGLSNLHVFKGVDFVVFTEGGDGGSLTLREACQGKHYKKSQDISFWRKMFLTFRPDLKIDYRALGGKPLVRHIAHKIACGEVKNVCVAMDCDHDRLFCIDIKHQNILYTRLYSWRVNCLIVALYSIVWHVCVMNWKEFLLLRLLLRELLIDLGRTLCIMSEQM